MSETPKTKAKRKRIWRVIPDFPNYQASNDGKIRSTVKSKKILAQTKSKSGYFRVHVYKDKKQYTKTVHTLVAGAFLRPRTSNEQVNHKNGKKWDNRIQNLEWTTPQENALHRTRVLKTGICRGKNNPNSKINKKIALEIFHHEGSDTLIAEKYGISRVLVHLIKKKKRWSWVHDPNESEDNVNRVSVEFEKDFIN